MRRPPAPRRRRRQVSKGGKKIKRIKWKRKKSGIWVTEIAIATHNTHKDKYTTTIKHMNGYCNLLNKYRETKKYVVNLLDQTKPDQFLFCMLEGDFLLTINMWALQDEVTT